MRLDKIRFAKMISVIEARHALNMSESEIQLIDDLIDIEVLTQPVNTAKCSDVDHFMMLMAEGTRKIEAIKAYRVLTGAGLKESKDAVEKYWTSPVKSDTRVDSMLKKIDEQINGTGHSSADYVLGEMSSLSCVKDFIKSFHY